MALKVNMKNVKSGFEIMPTDQYLATFAKFDVRTSGPESNNPGNKYFNLEFHIDADEHPAYKNRRQWGGLGATPDSLWAAKEFLLAMGYPREELEDEDGDDPNDMTNEEIVAALTPMLQKVVGGKVVLDITVGKRNKKLPNGEIVEEDQNKIARYINLDLVAA